MVDTGDLKSLASNGVRVQVPPWAPVDYQWFMVSVGRFFNCSGF